MMNRFGRRTFVVVLLTTLSGAGQDSDSATNDSGQDAQLAKFRTYAKEVATSYQLRLGDADSRTLTLVAEPVLRWSNPLGGQQARGEIFLWTDAGLPAAIVSINEFTSPKGDTAVEQEWCSLVDGPLIATGSNSWSPSKGVLLRQTLNGVDAPADSAALRRRQLGDLAARFAGEKTTRAGVTRALRLLPKPIYRYSTKEGTVIDGALFALAEATDAEAILVLEARRTDKAPVWQYAFARMTSVRLTATFDEKPAWEAPQLNGTEVYGRKDKPYTAFLGK
jgi:hypothetical protein